MGDDEEADLLAELRKISSRSSSRFLDDDNKKKEAKDGEADTTKVGVDDGSAAPRPCSSPVIQPSTRVPEPSLKAEGRLPSGQDVLLSPWKRYLKTVSSSGSASHNGTVEEILQGDDDGTAPPAAAAAAALPELPQLQAKTTATEPKDALRGGPAQDDELLALLRGVSAQSASASRFDDPGDGEEGGRTIAAAENSIPVSGPSARCSPDTSAAAMAGPPLASAKPIQRSGALPPWKRTRNLAATKVPSNGDVVVAVGGAGSDARHPEERTASSRDPAVGGGEGSFRDGNPDPPPASFRGERGGAAEDAELLALLRGVSAQSASASRFQDDSTSDKGGVGSGAAIDIDTSAPPHGEATAPPDGLSVGGDMGMGRATKPSKTDSLPPWKRPRNPAMTKNEPVVEVIVDGTENDETAEPPAPKMLGLAPKEFKTDKPSSYTGERGGDAHDDELLALLRGVSAKSSSASRFESDDNEGGTCDPEPAPTAAAQKPAEVSSRFKAGERRPAKSNQERLPPWKRSRDPSVNKGQRHNQFEVLVPEARGGFSDAVDSHQATEHVDVVSSEPSVAERSGEAHDVELLASMSSSGRLGESAGAPHAAIVESEPSGCDAGPPNSTNLPDAASRGSSDPPKHGIKSDIPSTFQGERGGAAEDAELLALLRGVSDRASSSRFDEASTPATGSSMAPENTIGKRGWVDASRAPFPHRRVAGSLDLASSAAKGPMRSVATEQEPVAEAPGMSATADTPLKAQHVGLKRSLPQTLTGGRGGSAEDAELLALLKCVSSNSADRFANTNEALPASPQIGSQSGSQSGALPLRTSLRQEGTAAPPQPTVLGSTEISREDLPSSLNDKNWKVRVAAIEYLTNELLRLVSGQTRAGNLESNQLLPGLDESLPKLLEDSNASVLDKALDFTFLYAEHCQSAGNAEQASRIVSSLVQKNGFSSRPSTAKNAGNVALKLMEVGSEGPSSIHAITNVLLDVGLSSKKQKVVQGSIALIHDAATEFGASNLPLASIIDAAPKLLSHSNQNVRSSALQIVAEICRALGSKSHIQDVLDNMKKAQVSELDSLLTERPEAAPARRELRIKLPPRSSTSSIGDAAAALQEGARDLAVQRFAARPSINLMQQLASTDFYARVALSKWSEKVAALNDVLECAGEKPYKLVAQSSTTNYAPLISELRKLLGHTHFAVSTKSMEVLSALAEGVGETLSPLLRPLLTTLLRLAKDKKLTGGVNSCLDSFFGRILGFDHLLENDDSLCQVLDEIKERNALARAAAMEFLVRCVVRNESSGPRGSISRKAASGLSSLFVEKLEDSSAAVRKASLDGLKALRDLDSYEAKAIAIDVIESLKEKNPRAYKAIAVESLKEAANPALKTLSSSATVGVVPISVTRTQHTPTADPPQKDVSKTHVIPDSTRVAADGHAVTLDRALTCASSLRIPLWDAPEDDAGILAGLRSSKWMLRQDAIKSITAFIESGELNSSECLDLTTSSLLTIVGEYTRDFKETNVNIMKSIIRMLVSLCETHEAVEAPVNEWVAEKGVSTAVGKISDKKLSDGCKQLLSCLCSVYRPLFVLLKGFENLNAVKSPLAHEEFLRWMSTFNNEFGCLSLGAGVNEILPFLIQECASSSMKVKRESLLIIGTLFTQIGPSFKAVAMNVAKPALREELEKCFESRKYDVTFRTFDWPKRSLLDSRNSNRGQEAGSGVALEVPRFDIMASLGEDCISRLMSKDGKTAWKVRKEALDEVEMALKRITGLVNVTGSHLKNVIDLTRALRDRLSDTQINLKPVAARIIAALLSVVDKTTQAKLGRIVYAPLINAAMNDIKKPMRDAALEALRSGTMASELDGGGVNEEALEPFVVALVGEVTEASARAGGLPDVLQFLLGLAEFLPSLDDNSATRGQSLGEKFAGLIVECLTSSKTETRAVALELLDKSIERNVISVIGVQKVAERLKPAKHRTVGPVIAKYALKRASVSLQGGKENAVPSTSLSALPHSTPQHEGIERTGHRHNPPGISSRVAQIHEPSKHPLILRGGANARAPISWLDYPEEPTGAAQYVSLRQSWSGILPPSTVATLFPAAGIKKQDDAQSGCDLIVRAVELDASSGSQIVESQTDSILRWLVLVLCSKEATVGLHSILTTVKVIFTFFMERRRPLTDTESLVIVPFILDRAGNAKGRFRDMFIDLVSLLETGTLLSLKSLGVMSVMVVERSSHAKGRVFACRLCAKHVQTLGTVFVGKRGILVMAKALSEESIPENKLAVLDVMVAVLSKMNGDIQKLARLCDQNLSEKARGLVEERWVKGNHGEAVDDHEMATQPTPTRRSYIDSDSSAIRHKPPSPCASQGLVHSINSIGSDPQYPEANDGSAAGTAAVLRARLLRVREVSKPVGESGDVDQTNASPPKNLDLSGVELYNAATDRFNILTSASSPIDENDITLLASLESLKQFHAALSMQPSPGVNLSATQLVQLREQLTLHMHDVISRITSLVRSSFHCGPRSVNAGVSVPLVSVCLATLMAMLRDAELAALFSHEDLSVLIREACTALLDPRLAGESELDESTSSQMVRAINKLAVQAATDAPRTAAFQALMSIQGQLLREVQVEWREDRALLNSRLSRVVSKLFGRVVKSEEAKAEPYSAESVDLEALICMIEDALSAQTAEDAVTDMARVLTESIVSTYGASAIMSMLQDMGMGLQASKFSEMARTCLDPGEDNAMLVPSPSHGSNLSHPATPPDDADQAPSSSGAARDVASLVSALGSAPQGPIREQALVALREYTASNGEDELSEHLQHVSSPFRVFIEQQLQWDAPRSTMRGAGPRDRAVETGTMSARLKSLRSRLAATELAVQTAVDDAPPPQLSTPRSDVPDGASSAPYQPQSSPPRRTSRLSQPTPSKLTKPSQSKLASLSPGAPPAGSLTLRERLAASQESRRQLQLQQVGERWTQASTRSPSSAIGSGATTGMRSATLRARLEAAKQLQKQQQT